MHAAAVAPIPAAARPTLQLLFGSHLAANAPGGAESPVASPADAGSAGAPADAADRGEEAMDALAHDIVEHPLLHDKLAHVPDGVLEQLVRQVGRRALIRIATGGAEFPTAEPASAQVPTEGLQGPDAAGSLPARTGLLARIQSRPVDGPEGHAAEQDSQELAGEDAHEVHEAHEAHGDHHADDRAEPSAAVQRRTGDSARDAPDPAAIHASARRGLATPATQLPFRDTIQRVFGRHDVSSLQAHVGPEAARSAHEMGADAYATGNHVVLGDSPDLFTTAHEAAHVIQQRAGVHCKGGVGEADDRHEQHADEVAQRVVQGKSAEALLDRDAGGSHERGGLQEPPVPAQSAMPAGPPIVQRHHRGKWVTSAAPRSLGGLGNVGASRVSWRRPIAFLASEGEPLTSSTAPTPSSTPEDWSKRPRRWQSRRTSWLAPRPPLPGMAAQPAGGEILPPPVLGVKRAVPAPRGFSSSTEQGAPASSARGSAAFEQHKEKAELNLGSISVHEDKERDLGEQETVAASAEVPALPKSWDKLDPTTNDQFRARLNAFRGNENLNPNYSGGEGRVFAADGKLTALKRWFKSRLGDMPASLSKLRDARSAVESHPELHADVDVVKIYEVGPDWILRDFDPNSVELKAGPAEAQAARVRAIAELEAQRSSGGLSSALTDLLNKLKKQPPSANLHWSPSKGKIVVIDMQ
jgi:hypothetical protein